VLNVFTADVIDAKVVYTECEGYRAKNCVAIGLV
jgi:hypothetical protein